MEYKKVVMSEKEVMYIFKHVTDMESFRKCNLEDFTDSNLGESWLDVQNKNNKNKVWKQNK